MSEYRIDSHKLMYHPHRVSDWLKNKSIYPIYIEMCPYGGCNHRCIFCAYNYTKYKPIFLDTSILKSRIENMAKIGVKAIMYAGEGEPLLHKDITDIINHTKLNGINVAVTTNGVMFTKEFSEKCLKSISWIKISVDAGTPETYKKLHCAPHKDFHTVLDNDKDNRQFFDHIIKQEEIATTFPVVSNKILGREVTLNKVNTFNCDAASAPPGAAITIAVVSPAVLVTTPVNNVPYCPASPEVAPESATVTVNVFVAALATVPIT